MDGRSPCRVGEMRDAYLVGTLVGMQRKLIFLIQIMLRLSFNIREIVRVFSTMCKFGAHRQREHDLEFQIHRVCRKYRIRVRSGGAPVESTCSDE